MDEMPVISSLRKTLSRVWKVTGRELARILELKAGLYNYARNGQSVQNRLKLPSEANFSSRRFLRSRRGIRELRHAILETLQGDARASFYGCPKTGLAQSRKKQHMSVESLDIR